jgi:hypothetical protein
MHASMTDDAKTSPDSLLPYDAWTENALRQVVVRAIIYAGTHGLPGEHHFYITFRTDHPGVVIPARLRAQYPQEMTIVLQHQFWDLEVDEAAGRFSVRLSFSGIPALLVVPLGAVTAFADPAVRFGLGFQPVMPEATVELTPESTQASKEVAAAPPAEAPSERSAEPAPEPPQVVSLDAFRRRPPAKT